MLALGEATREDMAEDLAQDFVLRAERLLGDITDLERIDFLRLVAKKLEERSAVLQAECVEKLLG